MKTLIGLLGVFTLVAILVFPASAIVIAQGDEDWVVYMTMTADPNIGSFPGEGYNFGFGAQYGASDGYDGAEGDEIAPPDPLAGINAHFYYPVNPPFQRNLIVSVTAPAESITWPLVVKMIGETGNTEMTISWPDVGGVPAKYTVLELQDTGGTTLADMRSVDRYTFSASNGQTYNFQIEAEAEEVPEYDLAVSSTEGGNVTTPGEGVFTYHEGQVVDLVAEVEESYRFIGWTGDVGTISNPNATMTTITMEDDHEITANFEEMSHVPPLPIVYDLAINSTDGGSVTNPGEGTFTYDAGTLVNLVAEPDENYEFVRWIGDLDTIAGVNAATTTITMGGNYSITAEFHEILAPTDWLLVGGITAVVVVVGLLAFLFVRRRRRAA